MCAWAVTASSVRQTSPRRTSWPLDACQVCLLMPAPGPVNSSLFVWEEGDEEFITISKWRGKHNLLSIAPLVVPVPCAIGVGPTMEQKYI